MEHGQRGSLARECGTERWNDTTTDRQQELARQRPTKQNKHDISRRRASTGCCSLPPLLYGRRMLYGRVHVVR